MSISCIVIERANFIGYAISMRLVIFSVLIMLTVCANAETVYKTVDENGNIIFTDKPSKNSEEIKLQKLQTIKNPNPAKFTPRAKPSVGDEGTVYKTFLISNPADGSGLRSNSGNVTVSLTLEPPLRSGHKVIISLDGKEISSGTSTSVVVQMVDRGTHSVSASILDSKGAVLKSTSSSFSLLRASQ